MDYNKLGLKAGIEVHNQLNTRHKLFCNCATTMSGEDSMGKLMRKQHPVASELGEYDIATQYEAMRDRSFVYEAFRNETCHVELDEEPPHKLNQEALETAITVSMLLNCNIVDEVHVMRKTVIDGSNTTSFQRTMVIGMNGYFDFKGRKVPIDQVSLEEDASAIDGEKEGVAKYKLNRLGIPLIEVATGLLVDFSPKEIEEIALHIGMAVRSTGKAKKVIGAIRQDVNVSIAEGARNEIKGIQELGMLSKSVDNEVNRQLSMIVLKNELIKMGVKKIHDEPVSVTSVLSGTENKILKSVLDKNGNIYAVALPKFGGLLKKNIFEGKTLGREFADVAVAFGLKGMFHSDEDLSKYNLEKEFDLVRKHLKAKPEDAIVITGEDKTHGKAIKEVLDRARTILKGVQEGTRSALPDGSTKFNRPLPGGKRMYPESDIVPIPITKELLNRLKSNLPEPLEKRLKKLEKTYKISHDLAEQIIKSDQSERFESIIKSTKVEPKTVANAIVSVVKDLEKRERINTSKLEDTHFIEIFKLLEKNKIVKESIPEVMKFFANNPNDTNENAIKKLGIKTLSQKEIESIVKDAISKAERPEKAIGIAMSKLRGKVDAKIVVAMVKKFGKK